MYVNDNSDTSVSSPTLQKDHKKPRYLPFTKQCKFYCAWAYYYITSTFAQSTPFS